MTTVIAIIAGILAAFGAGWIFKGSRVHQHTSEKENALQAILERESNEIDDAIHDIDPDDPGNDETIAELCARTNDRYEAENKSQG